MVGWLADPSATRRPHRQEGEYPGLLDVLRGVSSEDSWGADRGNTSSCLWKIEPPNHGNIQAVPNQGSDLALSAWRQGSPGFHLRELKLAATNLQDRFYPKDLNKESLPGETCLDGYGDCRSRLIAFWNCFHIPLVQRRHILFSFRPVQFARIYANDL